jgi:hypothetical protein
MTYFKKLTSSLLAILLIFGFFGVVQTQKAEALDAEQFFFGAGAGGGAANDLLGAAVDCATSGILGSNIQDYLGGLLGGSFSGITDAVNVGDVKLIPKEVGTSFSLFGLVDLSAPSMDEMATCIVDSMLQYVQQAAVNFIYNGIDGSPAFVENVRNFMTGTAGLVGEEALGHLGSGIFCDPYSGAVQESVGRSIGQGYDPLNYPATQSCQIGSQVADLPSYQRGIPGEGSGFATDTWYFFEDNAWQHSLNAQDYAERLISTTLDQTQSRLEAAQYYGPTVEPGTEDGTVKSTGSLVKEALETRAIEIPIERNAEKDEVSLGKILVDSIAAEISVSGTEVSPAGGGVDGSLFPAGINTATFE